MSPLITSALICLVRLAPLTQEQATQILLIVREEVRPDSAEAYAQNELVIARTCARLKCPHTYLALAPLDGRKEVWWLNAFTSRQDKERVDRAWASNTRVVAQLRPFGKRKEHLRRALTTTLTSYRYDLSSGHNLRIIGARFFVIAVTRDRAKLGGAVFQSPDGEYFAIRTATTRQLAETVAARMGSASRIFEVQTRWSFPSDSWVAADPGFWKQTTSARASAALSR